MTPSLASLVATYGPEAAYAIEAALVRGVSLGESIATIAANIAQALQTSLFRALVTAKNWITGAFRAAKDAIFGGDPQVVGWRWQANLGSACLACTLMDGTVHAPDEEMDSHTNCSCQKEPVLSTDADASDVQSGEDWFNEQDESTQQDILGSATRYQLWKSGQVSLQDMVGVKSNEYGRSIYVKPLKDL